jgi:AraC-like DNA-binding protein
MALSRQFMSILDRITNRPIFSRMGLPHSEPPAFVSRQVADARRFYLDLNPPSSAKRTVVCGGWERVSPDYRIARRDFPYFCLEFVAGGLGRLTLGDESRDLHRGVSFTYGPGTPHAIATDPGQPLSKYYVDFTGATAAHLLNDCGLEPGTCLETGDPERIEIAFARLIEAGSHHGPGQARIAALQLEILLLEIAGARIGSPGQGQSYQTFLRCRELLDARYLDLATAEEAAAACHLDPAYLSRLFARYADESPYRYLLRKKMTHAADLLDGGRRIVREVAADLGMDPFHFSRVFKRVLGVSPSEFARRRDGGRR